MDKCSLCKKNLREKENDLHGFDHPYELPYRLVWNDEENFTLTNVVAYHLCNTCIRKIMKTVNECVVNSED